MILQESSESDTYNCKSKNPAHCDFLEGVLAQRKIKCESTSCCRDVWGMWTLLLYRMRRISGTLFVAVECIQSII